MTKICNIMTKWPASLYTVFARNITWSGHRPDYAHPSTTLCMLFVATPPSAASISLFFTIHFYESPCLCIFLHFADFLPLLFFVWLYSVNLGKFDLSLLIYIFQYMGWMDILFLLLWFGFRENWRTKGLSEQVFASCYQDFVFFAQEIFYSIVIW